MTTFTTTAEVYTPEDPAGQALKVTRDAPPGGAVEVTAPLYVNTRTHATSNGFEWNAYFKLDNYANAGENTALYTKGYKRGLGATWAACFEARDISGQGGGGLYALELDLIGDGYQPGRNALKVMYGPQTNAPGQGAGSKSDNGAILHQMTPGDGSSLINGWNVWRGNVDHSFESSATGESALHAAGTYSKAVVDASDAAARFALLVGRSQTVRFLSGANWYSGHFAPNVVGALAIVIDNTTLYLPLCNNHP